jgi:nicotinate phosphoribosyltransferase
MLTAGKMIYGLPSEEMREQRQADMERLDSEARRLVNPHIYHVSLTGRLWDLKQALIQSAKEESTARRCLRNWISHA